MLGRFKIPMRDFEINETLHEPELGARTALSVRTGRRKLADMAVRAPVPRRFMAPMRDFRIVKTFRGQSVLHSACC